ncbi:MAG: sulfur transferase domain-containing protein, partial [Qipengyuania sp.]
ARLAAIGVRHVINLALDDHPEALADEERLLTEQGIGYTHIPVPFDAPHARHVAAFRAAFRAALEQSEAPVHVHCIMNYRVTAFFYLTDLEAGVDEQAARARMATVWDPLSGDDAAMAPWKELLSP